MSTGEGDGVSQSATVYIKGIDEKIKIPVLIEAIKDLFEEVGTVVEVIAKTNIKAKGQAFVVFESPQEARDAIDSLQGFELLGDPMTLALAKTRSDATVLQQDGEQGLNEHKKKRIAEKERKQALEAAAEQQNAAKRAAADNLAERPAKTAKAGAAGGQVPDEYLPPSKILFLQNLPEDYDKDSIAAVFGRYPGYKETRMVPFRPGLAFVEYDDENSAISVKEQTAGIELGGQTIKVTYRRA